MQHFPAVRRNGTLVAGTARPPSAAARRFVPIAAPTPSVRTRPVAVRATAVSEEHYGISSPFQRVPRIGAID